MELIGARYSYDDDWVAAKIVEELLEQYPELAGIYITGPGVKGICETLKEKGRQKEVKVIGNDFLEENKEWMREGVINFLIGQNSYVQGYEPVMILFRLLLDHEFPKEERQYTEIVIKNKYNL